MDPSFFTIDESSFDISAEDILNIPSPDIDIPTFSQSIGITDFIDQEFSDNTCVPLDIFYYFVCHWIYFTTMCAIE